MYVCMHVVKKGRVVETDSTVENVARSRYVCHPHAASGHLSHLLPEFLLVLLSLFLMLPGCTYEEKKCTKQRGE